MILAKILFFLGLGSLLCIFYVGVRIDSIKMKKDILKVINKKKYIAGDNTKECQEAMDEELKAMSFVNDYEYLCKYYNKWQNDLLLNKRTDWDKYNEETLFFKYLFGCKEE